MFIIFLFRWFIKKNFFVEIKHKYSKTSKKQNKLNQGLEPENVGFRIMGFNSISVLKSGINFIKIILTLNTILRKSVFLSFVKILQKLCNIFNQQT